MKVSVRSVTPVFYRAGMQFTQEAREVDVDEKTLSILKDEKELVVKEVPANPPGTDKTEDPAKKKEEAVAETKPHESASTKTGKGGLAGGKKSPLRKG